MASPDDLHDLLARLRAAPPAADPGLVSPGFETRVLARVRSARSTDGMAWFWRWAAVFATVAVAGTFFVIQSYQSLAADSLNALDGGGSLLAWLL